METTGAPLFDAHCHLQDERLSRGASAAIAAAAAASVGGFSCCGSAEDDWEAVNDIAAAHPQVVASFGLHPWYVSKRTAQWESALETALAGNPRACVGEIGIDHAVDESTFADQEAVFVRQLGIAAKFKRPVSIHCRQAVGRLVELLGHAGGVSQGGIIHSYSGPPELVKTFESLGLSLSFSGSVTFPKSKRARASAAAVSADRLCIETDSPDLKPLGWERDVNEPASLPLVARAVAELRGVTIEEVAEVTSRNARRLFMR